MKRENVFDFETGENMSLKFKNIEENLKYVREKIALAAVKSGRREDAVRLMAVTKTVDVKSIDHAISCGVDLIGENRVQELLRKKGEIEKKDVEIHLIGTLQSNKIKKITGEADMIESVDSIRTARLIGERSKELGITTDILFEVNIGLEDSKSGFTPETVMDAVAEAKEIEGIRLLGLMAIPPKTDDRAKLRGYFDKMYSLFVDIGDKKSDNIRADVLSMGMSGDFEDAILCGANQVRVGSLIFGQRR